MLTKTDINEIGTIIKSSELRLTTKVDKLVKSSELRLTTKVDKLDRKLEYAINFLDRDYLKLLQRVEKIEEHLGINPTTSPKSS